MLIDNLNTQVIQSAFSAQSYTQGQQDYLAGFVENLSVMQESQHREVIRATVMSDEKNYTVTVELNVINGTIHLWGTCSCPKMNGCQHVAATLFQALDYDAELEEINTDVTDWLDDLQRTVKKIQPIRKMRPTASHRAPEQTLRLSYLLSYVDDDTMDLCIKIVYTKPLKSGKWSTPKDFHAQYGGSDRLSQDDQALIIQLEGMEQLSEQSTSYGYYPIEGAVGETLLKTLIDTGHCHWDNINNTAITLGDSKIADWHWRTNKKGLQTLHYLRDKAKYSLFSVQHIWYLNSKTGETGLFETHLDPHALNILLLAPPIPANQTTAVANMLTQYKQVVPIQAPQLNKDKKTKSVKPVPCLHLYQITEPRGTKKHPAVVLTFDYNGIQITEKDHANIIEGTQIHRDIVKEAHCIQQLLDAGWQNLPALPDHFYMENKDANHTLQDLLHFSGETLEKLRVQNWRIDIDPSYPYQFVDAPIDDWYSSIDEDLSGSGYQWFDLELGISIKGEKINLLPVLQNILKTFHTDDKNNPETVFAQLADGRYIPLPTERIRHIVNILIELYDDKSLNANQTLRLSKLHAMRLLELDIAMGAAKLRWLGGERLRRMAEKLTQFKGVQTVQPPIEFQGQLRPYQLEGLSWLQFLREYELSGILADDMGLGKTVQALSHILLEKTSGRMTLPSLIAAPTSLMFNWKMETHRFAPDLKILILHGADRKNAFDNLADYDLILTTYALLVRDKDILLKQPFYFFILDEAQCIKNAKTQAAQIALQIQAKHRLCLTGTPMENHLGELWSLFHFMMPGLLGEQTQFTRSFRTPIEKHGDQERRAHLNRRIAPFMLRRTKDKVLQELPEKIETIHYVELDGSQRDLYETIRISMQKKVRDQIAQLGLGRSHIIILEALLKLRQVCCDPRLLKIANAQKKNAPSAKLDLLMTLITELLAEGRRILLFSQFTEMLGLIEETLIKENIAYVKLTGKTHDRQTPVEQFQSGKVPLFLISLKAGGTGLNLTAADTVIHYDPWWNPAVENQATDRAHRIGQDKTVFVYKLVAKGTVEEKILEMQHHKKALMEGLFSNETTSKTALSEEDLRHLFEPILDATS